MITNLDTLFEFIKKHCPAESKEGVDNCLRLMMKTRDTWEFMEPRVSDEESDELCKILVRLDYDCCAQIDFELYKPGRKYPKDYIFKSEYEICAGYLRLIEKAANMLLKERYEDTNIKVNVNANANTRVRLVNGHFVGDADFRNVEDVTVCVEFKNALNEEMGVRIDIHPDCILYNGYLPGTERQGRKFRELDERTLTSIMKNVKVHDNWKKGGSISISELPNNVSTM